MKTLHILSASVLVATAAVLRSQDAPASYVPVTLNQTVQPAFPPSASALGITSGAATLAISVDSNGRLADYLVTAYSHPSFAEEAVAALKHWTFFPARINGVPRDSKTDLTFLFEVRGVALVSMSPLTATEMVRYEMSPNSQAYAACSLADLDRIPNPKTIVNPVYPNRVAKDSRGGKVLVEFYIDPEGRVRMPSVSRDTVESSEELSAAAISAVSQWRFDQPTRKGKPVLVLAHQDFTFKPASK